MQSMRANASRLRFHLEPLSLLELSSGFQCAPSLTAVCAIPERVVVRNSFDGDNTDVEGTYTLVLESDGRWEIAADFKDEGTVFGDEFGFGLALRFDNDPVLKAMTYQGSLGARDRAHWSEAGMEPSFVHHWREIAERRFEISWHLKTGPITVEVLFAGLLIGFGTALGLLIVSGLAVVGPPGNTRQVCGWARSDAPGGVDYSCRWEFD